MKKPIPLLTAGLVLLFAAASSLAAGRPNILFIIADDQSPFDLKIYDSKSSLQTPHIDRLAAGGMVFDAAYHMGAWSGAVCTPSRHMVMSGRTLWHLPNKPGSRRNARSANPKLAPPNLADHTMAAVFNRAGYDTMRTCKRGNSYEAANKLFTVRHDASKRGGTDETGSAWHAEQVLDYLDQRETAKDNDPFLIYFGFSHPHDTRDGKPELLKKYGAVNHTDKNTLPPANPKHPRLPANYLPAHPFDNTHMSVRDEVNVKGVWKNRDERTIRNELGREFACSENIDIQIGRVLEKLKAMGELDNTYIFYTADHGIAIGRHGLQGKQNLYEHTWRIPFIANGPGIKPGTRVKGNIYLLDVLSTLCELTGIKPPKTSDGTSFKPVLNGKKDSVRDVLYGAYSGGAKPGIRCVRKGDWKLLKYESKDGSAHETQLFNLAENPDELLQQHHDPKVTALTGTKPEPAQVNLADDPRHADKLKEMEALLLAEMRRHDDPYRFSNQPDDGLKPPEPRKRPDSRKRPGKKKAARGATGAAAHGVDPGSAGKPAADKRWSVEPDPTLPNVLIIGDSISIGYTLPLRKRLAGRANVMRPLDGKGKPVNCGDSRRLVKSIKSWMGDTKWDVIHFNAGLHDLKRIDPAKGMKSVDPSVPPCVPTGEYAENLATAVGIMKKGGAKLVFATTTAYPAGVRPCRLPEDAVKYNAAAFEVMKKNDVAINDLYALTAPKLKEWQRPKNVHFHPKGSDAIAEHIAKVISRQLKLN